MAESDSQVKTEEPTQRRREESRQQGQVTVSVELNSAVALFMGTFIIWLTGPETGLQFREQMRRIVSHDYSKAGIADIQELIMASLSDYTQLMGAFMAVMFVTGLGISVAQVGFLVSPEAVMPKWNKLSPLEGWKRIVSLQGVMRGGFAILKVTVLTLVAAWVVSSRRDQIAAFGDGDLEANLSTAWTIIIRLLLAISACLVLLGLADFAYQRHRNEQKLKMSRHELKEELKRDEGDPMIRGRRRAIGRELANQRKMIEEVEKATVVITNPTHLAIALRYVRGEMAAPKVMAKGRGEIARAIVERARRHSIPVVERKPAAQAMFKLVKVGEEIPVALYYAISEVLAYVFRLRGVPA